MQKLLDVTRETLELAIKHIKPNRKWTEVARLMQYHVERNGFSVVREFVGHGVGRAMHEDPKVPNFVTQEHLRGDFKLRPGMTIAVEPMVTMGRREVDLLSDGWTVVTHDRMPAAHFEHTVAVTEFGADVLSDGRVPAGARCKCDADGLSNSPTSVIPDDSPVGCRPERPSEECRHESAKQRQADL